LILPPAQYWVRSTDHSAIKKNNNIFGTYDKLFLAGIKAQKDEG
jgi:hypothetical protein